MDLINLAVTSVALLLMSLFFGSLATVQGNVIDAKRALKAVALFAVISWLLGLQLGVIGSYDTFLPGGVALCGLAVYRRRDTEDMLMLCFLGAASFAMWVFYYPMSGTQYGAGFTLAALDPAILAAVLLFGRPKRDESVEAAVSASPV